jgi:hypothetical protein
LPGAFASIQPQVHRPCAIHGALQGPIALIPSKRFAICSLRGALASICSSRRRVSREQLHYVAAVSALVICELEICGADSINRNQPLCNQKLRSANLPRYVSKESPL